jgi:hypothetical protein
MKGSEKPMDETHIDKLMKTLDITREEALQLIEDDKAIDRGAKMFDLDPELEKASKRARQAPRTSTPTPTKRTKKEDTDKGYLISEIVKALAECDKVEITNPERQIDFEFSGRKFRIVLSAPRS